MAGEVRAWASVGEWVLGLTDPSPKVMVIVTISDDDHQIRWHEVVLREDAQHVADRVGALLRMTFDALQRAGEKDVADREAQVRALPEQVPDEGGQDGARSQQLPEPSGQAGGEGLT